MKKTVVTMLAILSLIIGPHCVNASEEDLQQQIEDLKKTVTQLDAEVRQLNEGKAAAGETSVAGDPKLAFLKNVHLGADYRSRYGYREKTSASAGPDARDAFDHRIRVMFDYIDDSGVALKTRTQLYDNVWLGDRRASGSAGSDISSGEDNISLDYGFLEIPFHETWNFKIGRQEAFWARNFVTDDDRRDRISLMNSLGETSLGNMTVMAIYDKRQEGEVEVQKDDGDMVAVASWATVGDWTWGLLLDYWHGWADYVSPDPDGTDGYVLDDLWSISPTLEGTFGDGFEFFWTMHYMNGNGRGDGKYEPGQGFWSNESYSTFAVLGYNFDSMKVEVQGYLNRDGALVGAGWDSFSSVIQNSTRNDPNPIRLSSVGGLGYDGDDQWLAATRLSGKLLDSKVGWALAGGYVDTRNDDADPVNNGQDNLYNLEAAFVDVQASWRFYNTLELGAKYGYIFGDEDDDGPGAGKFGTLAYLSWNY